MKIKQNWKEKIGIAAIGALTGVALISLVSSEYKNKEILEHTFNANVPTQAAFNEYANQENRVLPFETKN